MDDTVPPMRKTVSGMPWIDSDGDTGFYTGDVNASNLPDGLGRMRYDAGPVVKGRWKEGEMEMEDVDVKPSAQHLPSDNNYAAGSSGGGSSEKDRQLQEFHERNQQFLQQAQSNQYQIQSVQQQQQQMQELHRAETEQLNMEIHELQEQVQQLSHELRITQDTHALNRDQSRAEIEMLHAELDRQNSRHEQIVSSLRQRLVESELARMKMQDQLSTRVEEDMQRDEELKKQWGSMNTRVLEDKKWVDEQIAYWKESMDEHRKRLSGAKVRGNFDAEIGNTGSDVSGGRKSESVSSVGVGRSRKSGAGSTHSSESEDTLNRRLSQRRLWGAHEEGDEEGDD